MPRVSAVVLLVLSVAVATCGRDTSGPTIPVPADIVSVAGNAQTGTVGTTLPQPLVALVTAADGRPVAGIAVSWQVTVGGGSVSASSVTTDSLGRASVIVTLGTRAGADTVRASVGRVSETAVFAATATPAAPARIAIASGNAQTGTVGEPLHDSLVVVTQDAYGNPSPDVVIGWAVSAGSGALSATATTTNAAGRAAVSWTLGTVAGTNQDSAVASVPGLAGSPATFVAVAHAGLASVIVRAGGDGQTGTVGVALADSLVVLARDQYGNPVSGAPVTWNAATGGTLSAVTAPTDPAGRSSVSWTLGAAPGAQQATATLPGAAGSPLSFGATANPGAPAALTFPTQPGATAAGTVISPAVRVAIVDAFGNTVPSAAGPIDLTLGTNAGGATLAGTTQATPASGIATFSDLRIDRTGAGYTLVASGAGLPAAASVPFEITLAGAPRLAFTVQPASATAGAAIAPAVEVTARDSLGNTFTTFTGAVTLAIGDNPGGGTLTGSVTVSAVGGVATFPDLTIDKSGSGYSLAATASGAATGASTTFDVTAGAAAQLAFIGQPSSPFQGAAITPAVQVSARDAFGNAATGFGGDVTVAIGTNPSSGTLSGTTTTAAVAGVAAFADLRIDSSGTGYTLTATASGLVPATSTSFEVVQNPFTRLVFTTQPTDAAAGAAIAPAVTVTALDQLGNPATGYSGAVTVSLGSNAAGGTLSGTTTAVAVAGIATFDDLHLDKRGAGYRLLAVAAGLAPDTSDMFTVRAGPPARITVQDGDGQTAPAGTALPIPYLVDVRDAFDNPVSGATVSWSVTGGGGAVNPAQSSTDSTGHASGVRTLGLHAGTHTAAAAVAGLADSVASFSAIATPNGTISGTITATGGSLAPPAPVSAAAAAPQPAYTSDELIVTYRAAALGAPPVGSAALAAPATAARVAVAIRGRLGALPEAAQFHVRGVSPALLAARVQLGDSLQRDAIAAALRRDAAVESVERNGLVRLDGHRPGGAAMAVVPGDPLYPRQAWHYGLIDLPRAWAITTGSAAVLVAVVDNGIRYDHPAVAGNLTHDGYDFVSSASYKLCSGGGTIDNAGDGDGYDADPTQPADYDINFSRNCAIGLTASGNHGLHVAGTIGAVGNDGVGVGGVNWTVRIRPVRVLGVAGFGTFYDIAQGILYAAGLPADDGKGGTVTAPSGARIINLSLGGPSGSTALHDAVISATNAGALVIAAAGNSGNTSLLYPAAYPEALSVSAVGPDALLASYSSYGSTVDIASPGGDQADGDASFGVLSSAWNFVTGTPIYDSWDGTSMATPHVSGVAALLLAQDPSLTGAQLRARLTTYAVDAGAPGPDDQYGAGIVNARNSLTQSLAPPRATYARLYGADGLVVATIRTAADGSYAFTGLGDASYTVYGGTDESGDGQVGLPGRLWGALGGSAAPAAVTVDGAANYPATFAIAWPTETEPNDTPGQANALALGGYVNAAIGSSSDVDVFRVRVPANGTYTFETSAVNGACGFALEANTALALEDSAGTVLASSDDVDAAALNYCSRISLMLPPGTYFATVSGLVAGRYRLAARASLSAQ